MINNLRRFAQLAAGSMLAGWARTALAADGDSEALDPGELSEPVAILVIDDFGVNGATDETETDAGNCSTVADGQVFAARGAMSGGGSSAALVDISAAAGQQLTHGDLVWAKFRDILSGISGAVEGPPVAHTNLPLWIPQVTSWTLGNAELLLVAVDTVGFTTGTMANRIARCLEILAPNYERFVLNMSFAIIPCGDLTESEYLALVADELAELRDVLQAGGLSDNEIRARLFPQAQLAEFYGLGSEAAAPDDQSYRSRLDRILGQLESDPVRVFLQTRPAGVTEMINVAAAGNAGLAFPFAPAIWNNVLAVGAAGAQDELHRYGNQSEVIAYDVVEIAHQHGGTIPLHGTSFAAPEVSVRAALHLAAGGSSTCPGGTRATTPPLAYAGEMGVWENLTLRAGQQRFCAEFPVDLP